MDGNERPVLAKAERGEFAGDEAGLLLDERGFLLKGLERKTGE